MLGRVTLTPSLDLLTYPKKVWCQVQWCQPRTRRGRSAWVCWLLSCSLVLSLLPSEWAGMGSFLKKSGFALLPLYQELNYSQAASLSSPPSLFYLQLQVSVVNHFLGTSCSLPLKAKSCTRKIVAAFRASLWPGLGKASSDHSIYSSSACKVSTNQSLSSPLYQEFRARGFHNVAEQMF